MTIFRHELRLGRKALAVWTVSVAFLMAVCVFMFPEMKGEMGAVSDMFSSMGSFTRAFGMDRLNFGSLLGFYSIECGNILGLGGAFYAALTAVAVLAKEEKDRTAEFLLAHPVSRRRVLTEKLAAVVAQVLILNAVSFAVSVGSMAAVGEAVPWKEICLLHLAYLFMQLELTGICFAISAYLRRGGLGIGIGLATAMYFLNIVANLSDKARFLKYFTAFGYTEGADIATTGAIDGPLLAVGMATMAVCIGLAYLKYCKKDIA